MRPVKKTSGAGLAVAAVGALGILGGVALAASGGGKKPVRRTRPVRGAMGSPLRRPLKKKPCNCGR